MSLTITLPDDLIERLRDRGIRDADAVNRYAVAAISAFLDEDQWITEAASTPISAEDRHHIQSSGM